MSHELEELIEFMTAEGEYNKLRCRFTTAFLTCKQTTQIYVGANFDESIEKQLFQAEKCQATL